MPGNSRGHPPSQRSTRTARSSSIPSNYTPPAIASSSAPTQRSPVDAPQQASASQFQHTRAKNFRIQGGQFITESGPRVDVAAHVTINMPQPENGGQHPMPIPQPNATLPQDEQTPDQVEITNTKLMPSEDEDTATAGFNLGSESPPATKTWNELYETHLAPNKRGYPLWIPEPNKNLPLPYQRKGVQIGDVGIVKPSGAFSFIFNICVPSGDPINPGSLPEDFVPIHPSIDEIDICKFAAFKAGSYLSSTSIEKSRDDTTSPGLCFQASAPRGAILTMPEGAMSEDLENLPRFRRYAAENVQKWYRYINGYLGREAKNGDIRLVVGCDKATSWGMAALSNMTRHSRLKFKPVDAQSPSSSSCGYTWEYSGAANVKVGPDQKEIDELRREDPNDSPTWDKYPNQCLFVRTLNVKLNDEDWENLNHEIGVSCTPDSIGKREAGMPFRAPGNRGAPSDSARTTFSGAGGYGTQRNAGDSPAVASTPLGINISRLAIDVPPTATSWHPSHILNEILLDKIPTAKMVITHDEDWYPCVEEDMTMSSNPERILASILSVNDIREENGIVYLEPKVTREMKYFADLETLSNELEKNSSNLEEYLYGVDPRRSARRSEIIFLLELCRDALSASARHADNNTVSSNSLPDTQRIREIEVLIGSLLIDELFLDKPDTFGSIYALRPSSQTLKPFTSSFRSGIFEKVSSILGRGSTDVTYLNSPTADWRYREIDHDIGWKRSKRFLAFSSYYYLLYLALGELSDLEHTIENFRKLKLPTEEESSKDKSSSIGNPGRTGPIPIYIPERHAFSNPPWMQSGRDPRSKDYGSTDPRWHQKGRDPTSEQRQTGLGRPSRDDNVRPAAYHPSGSGPYKDGPAQASYNTVATQYFSHSSHPFAQASYAPVPPQAHPHALAPTQAIPPRPSQPYPPQASYGSPLQSYISPTGHLPPASVPTGTFPSGPSAHSMHPIANLTTQLQETTVTAPRRQERSFSRVPFDDDEDDDRYPDQSRNRRPKTGHTVPSLQGGDEYDYAQGQRGGYPGEGSSRSGDTRVQPSSHRSPITLPPDRRNYPRDSHDLSRQPPQDPFNSSYSYSSTGHLPDRGDPRSSLSSSYNPRIAPTTFYAGSRPLEEEDEEESSDESGSNSGSETEAPNSRMKFRGGDAKSRSKTVPIPIRPPLDTHRGLSDPSGVSASASMAKSWVAEQFGDSQTRTRRKQDSSRPPAQQGSSRPDQRVGGTNADYVPSGQGGHRGEGTGPPSGLSRVMSQQPWVEGQSADMGERQSRRTHQEGESARSSNREQSRVREVDEDYVGNYRDRGQEPQSRTGGQPPGDSETRWSQRQRKSRLLAQQSSSHQDPQSRVTASVYVSGGPGGYRVEASGGPPALSQAMSQQTQQPAASDERQSRRLNPMTSVPQHKREERPPEPGEPSHTKSHGPYPPMDTTRPPQYDAPYLNPSRIEGSLDSKPPENTWVGGPSRPGARDSSSNPSVGAMESNPHDNRSLLEWRTYLPKPDLVVALPFKKYQSHPPAKNMPRDRAVGGGDKDALFSTSTNPYHQQPTKLMRLALHIQPLGNPSLVPLVKDKDEEKLGLRKDIDSHILPYMSSNIIDVDTIALWFPTPIFTPGGGSRGIQVGDLGYFDEEGEFHPIFNIFRSYEDNIAEGGRPPSQPYQHLHIHRNWVREVDIQRQQTYTSANIEKRDRGPNPQIPYQFRTYKHTGRSGAIIVLPHGGTFSCIRRAYFSLPDVKRHFHDYAPSWYQHALQCLPKKTNGSLILVRATHSARSWGIAAFAEQRSIREPLIATFRSNPANEYQHMWQTNDSKWKTKTGPSSNELANLQGRDPPSNQCIGVVISSLRLDEATWQANFGSLASPLSVLDRGGVGFLGRRPSRDSIRVDESSGGLARRIRDSLWGRPTSIDQRYTQASVDDDYTLLIQEPQ